MRSLLPGQLSSIGSLEEDAQAWNRVWCEHLVAWKGLVQKFVSASLEFDRLQDPASGETGAVEEAGSPRAEHQCPGCSKCFSAPEQGPLMSREYMAREGQLWRMQGMEGVLAVRASFIREFGWSIVCIRQ